MSIRGIAIPTSESNKRETLLRCAEFDLHLSLAKDGDVPFIHPKFFILTLESCSSFFADWSTWLSCRKFSHQAAVLCRSFREFVLFPLQCTVLKLKRAEELEPYQDECDEWRHTLPILFQLARTFLTEDLSETPCVVYNLLFIHLNNVPVDSSLFSILRCCWRPVIYVLAAQLRTAFFDNVLDDFHSELFIESLERRRDGAKGVPFHRYCISRKHQPCFVSAEAAENILFVIHATDCNSMLVKRKEQVMSAEELSETFAKIADTPQNSTLILDSASSRWRRNAASILSSLVPVSKIRHGLAKLRALLLLGNELIWRAFFDELREHRHVFKLKAIDPRQCIVAQRTLNSILSAVYDEHGLSIESVGEGSVVSEKEDISLPLVLLLNEEGNVIPKYTLSDIESIMLAHGTPVYCDLFGLSFTVRYVGFELKSCYLTLMALYRRAQLNQKDLKLLRFVRIMTLVRVRMASVIDSLDWYVQGNVIQPKIEKLDKILTQDHSSVDTLGHTQIPFLEQFYSSQDENVKIMSAQCMLSNTVVFQRYEAIFSSCLSLCESIENVNTCGGSMKASVHQALKAETQFSRNVNLFAKILRNSDMSCFESSAICQLQRRLDATQALPSVVVDTLTTDSQ